MKEIAMAQKQNHYLLQLLFCHPDSASHVRGVGSQLNQSKNQIRKGTTTAFSQPMLQVFEPFYAEASGTASINLKMKKQEQQQTVRQQLILFSRLYCSCFLIKLSCKF